MSWIKSLIMLLPDDLHTPWLYLQVWSFGLQARLALLSWTYIYALKVIYKRKHLQTTLKYQCSKLVSFLIYIYREREREREIFYLRFNKFFFIKCRLYFWIPHPIYVYVSIAIFFMGDVDREFIVLLKSLHDFFFFL